LYSGCRTEKILYAISLDVSKITTAVATDSLLRVVPTSNFEMEGGGEAFWLDSRTIGYITEDKSDSSKVDAASKEESATRSALYAIPISSGSGIGKPSLLGHFPPAVKPGNVQYSAKASILVFTADVYADGDLDTVHKQDVAYEKRGNSAKVYDTTYVRHWDEWIGLKKSSIFTVAVKKAVDGRWSMGNKYGAPLKGTNHVSFIQAFAITVTLTNISYLGSEDYALSEKYIIYTTIDPEHYQAWHTRQNVGGSRVHGNIKVVIAHRYTLYPSQSRTIHPYLALDTCHRASKVKLIHQSSLLQVLGQPGSNLLRTAMNLTEPVSSLYMWKVAIAKYFIPWTSGIVAPVR
jgi:hypothetical protein